MALPPFLLMEMRFAFKSCACRNSREFLRRFTTFQPVLRKQSPPKAPNFNANSTTQKSAPSRTPTQTKSSLKNTSLKHEPSSNRDLVPQERDRKAIDTGRKVPVPMKVFPKADVTPNLRLSPQERLHLEVLTRRAPPLAEKKAYRERLLIYHWGFGRENALAILKMSCIVGLCAVTFVIAPAHFAAGTPLWITSLIFLAGFVPAIAVNYMTKPMVSRVFLRLPPTARESPKAAMEYARNLPDNAELDIRFLRPWALEGSIQARMSEFEPAQNNWLRPLTFQWIGRHVNKGSLLLPNPTKFFVAPKSATGKAARDTIPGLWENVYQKLSGIESDAVSRWKR